MNEPVSSIPTSLIVGAGEVGKGLFEVLHEAYPGKVFIRDIDEPEGLPPIQYLHLCFPFTTRAQFRKQAKKYMRQYKPEIVIIHSTVAVGTTRSLGLSAVHSPIRGKHPNLAEGIRTFVKFIGSVGTDKEMANRVAQYFINADIATQVFDKSETTELGKLLETTQYGWFIVLMKEIKRVCREKDLNFTEVYAVHNQTYNQGYAKLGEEKYMRPILVPMPGPIGGHCVVPNVRILRDPITKIIRQYERKYVNHSKQS